MLRVHFLNVGHGDCTIIEHPSGRLTMIDINNSQEYDEEGFAELVDEVQKSHAGLAPAGFGRTLLTAPSLVETYLEAMAKQKEELTDPVEFMQTHYKGRRLWRYIQSHPELDHMRGIRRLHETIGFDNFWDTNHTRSKPNFRNDDDKNDWEFYQRLRAGSVGPGAHFYTQGDRFFAFAKDENGVPGGDQIEILSPTPRLVADHDEDGKHNNLSVVLRVSHGGRSVLLPGDAEGPAWDSMRRIYGKGLKSDFLKASHHGRDTGYDLEALKLIAPFLTFVSVGRKPDTDASGKYRQQCERVVSTRYHGDIELRIHDDGRNENFAQRNHDS